RLTAVVDGGSPGQLDAAGGAAQLRGGTGDTPVEDLATKRAGEVEVCVGHGHRGRVLGHRGGSDSADSEKAGRDGGRGEDGRTYEHLTLLVRAGGSAGWDCELLRSGWPGGMSAPCRRRSRTPFRPLGRPALACFDHHADAFGEVRRGSTKRERRSTNAVRRTRRKPKKPRWRRFVVRRIAFSGDRTCAS